MKRALKFLFVFLAAAGAVYVLVIGLNYSAFVTLFENRAGMAEGSEYVENTYSLKDLTRFIADKPGYVSVMSYNVNDPDSGIFYQTNTPRTLGTLGNLFLLIEYERQVAAGVLSRDEITNTDEIERYALPQISENAHAGAMDVLTQNSQSFTLDEAMAAMLEYNDLAISDYFYFRLKKENISTLLDSLKLADTEAPVPFSGIYLALNPEGVATTPTLSTEYPFETLDSLSRKELFGLFAEAAKNFSNDDVINEAVKNAFENDRLNMTFIEERDALRFFPQTTAKDMTSLLERLYFDEVISPEVSRAVKNHLRWPLDSDPIQRSFSDYGAIYENRMGVLSGIDFGTSVYDGHTSVQAVFFDTLPVAFWHHMSANHMQEDYQQRLIWDPALYETTQNQISK